jgi:DNA-binding NarL/FixJ family response regulator
VAESRALLAEAEVAILDLGPPDGSGADLICELRSANTNARAIVLTTTYARCLDLQALEHGAAAVLDKLARLCPVRQAVGQILSARGPTDEAFPRAPPTTPGPAFARQPAPRHGMMSVRNARRRGQRPPACACRPRQETPIASGSVAGVTGTASDLGRVLERRRAVALARHYRESEGLSIRQIADRLGRSPATIKAYFYDPSGEKARAVKARYVGVCRGCGAYTQPRNGKGDAYAYCKACHPGAIEQRWTRERVVDAMLDWRLRYGRLPSSYDWSRTHACRRGGEAVERLADGEWPAASVVSRLFDGWAAASTEARYRDRGNR